MSDKPETRTREEAIDEVARDYLDAARRSGNTSYTFDEARERVARANRIGDAKRANGNR